MDRFVEMDANVEKACANASSIGNAHETLIHLSWLKTINIIIMIMQPNGFDGDWGEKQNKLTKTEKKHTKQSN